MDSIYESDNIKINKQNTLLLGGTKELKKVIKKDINKTCEVVDNTFAYSTKTVAETIENCDFNITNIKKISEKDISELTFDEYFYLAILIKINMSSSVLVIDNLFGYLNNKQKDNVIKAAKKNNVVLVVFDNELYDTFSDFNVIVIYENKVAIEGDFKDVVLQEKILKRLGYKLPFYVDLSIQLKLFGLIDDIYYTEKELEVNLWK